MIEFDKKWIAITSVSIAIFAVTIVGISSIPTASAGTLPLNCDSGTGTIQHYNKIFWHSEKRTKIITSFGPGFFIFPAGEPFETIFPALQEQLIAPRFQLEEWLIGNTITKANDKPIKRVNIIIDDIEFSTICFNTADTP